MEISYLGHSSFLIKGKDVTLVADPFDPEALGKPFPKVSAEIVTISHNHKDHNFLQGVDGKPFIINGPGEYEIKSVVITGITADHDKKKGKERGFVTMYLIELEEITILHTGDLGRVIDAKELEDLGRVDILMVPVGGKVTIDAEEASEVVTQIEPKIVIPMHYGKTASKELDTVEEFLQEMGEDNVRREKVLKINHSNLPEETEVVVLTAQ